MLARPVGHDQVRQWLCRAVVARRVAGGYLFTGPEGIGKAAFAREFAATLRCESPQQHWACGQCGQCLRVARDVHPNVRWFRKPADKTEFPVEVVREICDEASLRQLEPGRRVFIVDDADRFNESSANAFLKSLEEPPAGLTFVLLAGNVAEVLPTILSRCQAVRFAPLPEALMQQVSRGWQGQPVNPQSRAMLVRAAQGSPGRLKQMTEYATLDAVAAFLQAVARDPFHASELVSESISQADENEGRRDRLREVMGLLCAHLRDRLACAMALQTPPLLEPRHVEAASADHLLVALRKLDDMRQRVDGNVNLKLCCDAIALGWPA
ncbi:MAG: DNA polymerase III subunit delta' [Planctomycetes bacterium]|nr:DNA polymerase III subunit delta' [Planctomycetota bacterium]